MNRQPNADNFFTYFSSSSRVLAPTELYLLRFRHPRTLECSVSSRRLNGKFSRALPFPQGIKAEEIKAGMENDVSTVSFLKTSSEQACLTVLPLSALVKMSGTVIKSRILTNML
ncbi:hypothetical protein A0H81_05127 [Grifola frondosa]|uniref:SHSP domain-containing protein n=1 Tax=Grifola frondosa TaxID=5627 RepID=A0A1C7MD47_GRIFR|nr:hypothetical protein A0H81_05127 [Grifola frondosa]